MAHWGWPQWVAAAWFVLVLCAVMALPRQSLDVARLVTWAALAWTIWMGGFWS